MENIPLKKPKCISLERTETLTGLMRTESQRVWHLVNKTPMPENKWIWTRSYRTFVFHLMAREADTQSNLLFKTITLFIGNDLKGTKY
jgi:GH43 family beta-xylosidase